MRLLIHIALLALPLAAQPALRWHDIRTLGLQGQGWKDTRHPFDRLPAKAESLVRAPVWNLSHDSAGIFVRFRSAAPDIHARWTLRKERLALPHMPATGVSGLDLYVRHRGGWRWLANGRPEKQTNEQALVTHWSGGEREYLLYLPLYNGVESVELGIPESASLTPVPDTRKPIVFYGTSILQGGCASRPGMAYPAIIGRILDWPTINLGFSGNGKSEPEIASLLAELDPAAFVLDSLPNLQPAEVAERVEPFIRTIRQARPTTPIVLVENVVYTNSELVPARASFHEKNALLTDIYDKLRRAGDRNLYLVPAGSLLGTDGEGAVDGVHPTDLGFLRMAEAIAPTLRRTLSLPRSPIRDRP